LTTNPVLAALAQARMRAAPVFARWCELNAASFCPASPAMIAKFVGDCAPLGIARLWPAVQDISRTHVSLGLADPTLGGAVALAVSDVAGIEAPRSWPDDRKQQFKVLPYDLQIYIANHEARREKALRRAQNEAAAFRQKLTAFQQEHAKQRGTDETKANTTDANAPLEERIRKIRADIDAVIEEKTAAVAKENPGVPRGVIRNLLTARAPNCACSQYLELAHAE
jgi:hypothetical protein